jgi:[ribosomal protein S5]-alanine N-acetyltransferase
LDIVRSERIELVSLTRDQLAAILGGQTAEVEEALDVTLPPNWLGDDDLLPQWRLEQIESDPTSQSWLLRALILAEPRTCVGYFNFHGPPGEDGWVEMGYEILPEHRRRGYASEAALRMMRWAHDEHGVEVFRASIGPDNEPSLKMIEKLGFEEIGTQMDEIDGLEIVFERRGVPEL